MHYKFFSASVRLLIILFYYTWIKKKQSNNRPYRRCKSKWKRFPLWIPPLLTRFRCPQNKSNNWWRTPGLEVWNHASTSQINKKWLFSSSDLCLWSFLFSPIVCSLNSPTLPPFHLHIIQPPGLSTIFSTFCWNTYLFTPFKIDETSVFLACPNSARDSYIVSERVHESFSTETQLHIIKSPKPPKSNS